MMAKLHQRVDRLGRVFNVTALCDEELLGKVLSQGKVTLDLDKYRAFYTGSLVSESQAVKMLQGSRNVNAVGPKAVKCAKKALQVDNRHVKTIQGVPHIQIYYV